MVLDGGCLILWLVNGLGMEHLMALPMEARLMRELHHIVMEGYLQGHCQAHS